MPGKIKGKQVEDLSVSLDKLHLRVHAIEIYNAEGFGSDKVDLRVTGTLWGNWYKVLNVLILMVCASFTAGVYINSHPDTLSSNNNQTTTTGSKK